MLATTSYRFPVAVPAPIRHTASAWPSSDELLARGRAWYARWNTPMRAWPAPEQRIAALRLGRLQFERDRARLSRPRKLPKLLDRPHILPNRRDLRAAWCVVKQSFRRIGA